jgi:hypothetical protein
MKRLLNINEAAEYVGLHPQTIRKRIHEGTFPFLKTSDIVELDKWVNNLPGSQVKIEG